MAGASVRLFRRNAPAERDWKLVTIAFTPDQLDTLTELLDSLDGEHDHQMLLLAPLGLESRFNVALNEFCRVREIRSAQQGLAAAVTLARDWAAMRDCDEGLLDGQDVWVDLENVLMTTKIPARAANVVMEGIAKKVRRGEVNVDHWWQALEQWAAEELAR